MDSQQEPFVDQLEDIINKSAIEVKKYSIGDFAIYEGKIYRVENIKHIWLVLSSINDFLGTKDESILASSAIKISNIKLLRLLYKS